MWEEISVIFTLRYGHFFCAQIIFRKNSDKSTSSLLACMLICRLNHNVNWINYVNIPRVRANFCFLHTVLYHSFLCSQTGTALFIFNAISSLDIQTTQITHTDGLVMLLSFRSWMMASWSQKGGLLLVFSLLPILILRCL